MAEDPDDFADAPDPVCVREERTVTWAARPRADTQTICAIQDFKMTREDIFMKRMRRILSMLLAALLVLSLIACGDSSASPDTGESTDAPGGEAVDYPNHTITMVVPWGAGGGTDLVARAFGALLEQQLGESIAILNKTGATGTIGTQYVYDAAPDGHTILFSAENPCIYQVEGFSDLSFEDFRCVTMISDDPKIVCVAKDSPYQTMEELVQAMKDNPGKINMALSTPGASGHTQSLMYQAVGLDFNLVPLGGGTSQITSLLSGETDWTNPAGSTVLDYLATGEMRCLATWSSEPVPGYEEYPPITEAIPELEQYNVDLGFPLCICVSKDTPEEIFQIILEGCQKAAETDEWKTFVENNHLKDMTDIYGDEADAYLKELTSHLSYAVYAADPTLTDPATFGIEKID